jgi:hypothetical protein
MFEDNASQNFVATQDLYCVWIRADKIPGAPLIAVWMDTKMRAFETEEGGGASMAKGCRAVEEVKALDSQTIKHSI